MAVPNTPLGLFVKKNYSAKLQPQVFKKLTRTGFKVPGAAPAPPPDPLADLSKVQRGQITDYDAETTRQTPRIQESYAALGTALTQNADATKDRLASLGSLIQASPTVGGAPSPVAGGPGALADAARQGFGASAAVTVGQQSALPAIAATTGQQYLDQFLAARTQGREGTITSFRTSNAEAQQAAADRAAQIRGQNLQLLGTQLSQTGQTERAQLGAETDLAINTQDNQTDIAQTNATNQTRLSIAQLQAQARAVTSGKNKKPAAGRPGSPQYSSARQGYAKEIRNDFVRLVDEYVVEEDPVTKAKKRVKTGRKIEEFYNGDATASIIKGLARGLRPAHILMALRSVNPDYAQSSNPREMREDLGEFITALQKGGYPQRRANAIVKALTGVDYYPRAGFTGP